MVWVSKPSPGTPINWASPQARGLRALWPMGGATGTLYDISGNGLHGAPAGTLPTLGGARAGGSAHKFSGSRFLLSSSATIVPSGAGSNFTLSTWWFALSIANYTNIFNFGAHSSNDSVVIGPHTTTSYYVDSWASLYTPAAVLTLSKWHHTCLTADGTNWRLYHNGQLIDTTAKNPTMANGVCTLGGEATFGRNLDGYLDDMRVYNYCKNADEVRQLYTNPFDVYQAPGIRKWYVAAAGGGGTILPQMIGQGLYTGMAA